MIFSLITVDQAEAKAAEQAGIQRIMIDLERKGKAKRQAGRNLFLSTHCLEDVSRIHSNLQKAAVVVRINPLHDQTRREVDHVIQKGADYVMLPFFQCLDEVKSFHALVKGRVKTILLVETDGAVNALESIINNSPPDEIHIGLNDLSICFGQKNFFSLFLDGTVESIATRLRSSKIPFGIGGVAALSRAGLPVSPTRFFLEQIRLGATRGWLGRSFRESVDQISLADEFRSLSSTFADWQSADWQLFQDNHQSFLEDVSRSMSL